MTLLEIYTQVLNKLRMEATDIEPNIKEQIYHSVNEAYKIIAGKYKILVVDYLPVINQLVELPKNIIGAITFDPKLDSKLDRIIGDNLKTLREDTPIFTLTYYRTPDKLVEDTDVPSVPERLEELLILYPCYVYFVSKKRLDLASEYKSAFDKALAGGDIEQESQEVIENVYASFFN